MTWTLHSLSGIPTVQQQWLAAAAAVAAAATLGTLTEPRAAAARVVAHAGPGLGLVAPLV